MSYYGTDNANWYGGSISQHCIENTIRVVINGGEIKTQEEAKEFQHDASYTLYVIEKGGFSSYELAKAERIFKLDELIEEIENFRVQEWLKILDEESFLSAQQENNLKIMRKYHEHMKKEEFKLVFGEIDFNKFLIILRAYERQREKLCPSFSKYWAKYGADRIFKKHGFINKKSGHFLIDYEKPNINSEKTSLSPYIPPKELLEGDFRDLKINNKVIWGIGPKAITLVDGVGYKEGYHHPRYPIGDKIFINYKKNPIEAKKLAKQILEKYGG